MRIMMWGRSGRAGQLLLLVALLFGLGTMHTVGHPSPDRVQGHHGSVPAPGAHAPGGIAASTAARTDGPEPGAGHGMDPALVCLAVLGAYGVALLVVGLRRRARALAARVRRVRPTGAEGPRAPPPREVLTRLSVLRI
ncbi:DUF6153 family protein [Streptomyces clavuligerus]|uniref:Uncharacterized protein n=1 Tax=Streptomyces clavuligerus TaxID=1901 RepID=E2Q1S9_STRCL|nr:DUF6153 family protein [Streptomyces clavuligerus]ANW20469.1 hypothetical protein BB341_20785 [Streptomyces clavuligerus]AXU15096.1 hypothetical protein D1794_21635 [Streptomyces clavuligerus]EFG06555.1 Hypothetical protein SCLAV_1478 [Streptomyces clavuligerus]MBY6305156.1 hypothetical protein [Streptomyces clavuligerus]QCS07869.1 hypothetical protein CRV15_21000 [Streptomyces clavuligerus]